jgi:sec-independent protein translocase protein TatB
VRKRKNVSAYDGGIHAIALDALYRRVRRYLCAHRRPQGLVECRCFFVECNRTIFLAKWILMFDVGFSELLVIGVVALVVIGPERLPKVARTVGHLLGKMRRYVNEVKAEIDREVALSDLKKLQSEVMDSARELEQGIRAGARQMERDFRREAEAENTPAEDDTATAKPLN